MRRTFLTTPLATPPLFASHDDDARRLNNAAGVYSRSRPRPTRESRKRFWRRHSASALCLSLKRAGFIVGAKYGKGLLVCRNARGWSAPSTIRIEGGSIGLQIGVSETDLVFIVKNKSGENKLMQDKFTIGADAQAAAGPVGRTAEAQTDVQMRAEILSYSRARGVFAGISLDGSTLRPDNEDNAAVYGRALNQREILTGQVRHPAGKNLAGC